MKYRGDEAHGKETRFTKAGSSSGRPCRIQVQDTKNTCSIQKPEHLPNGTVPKNNEQHFQKKMSRKRLMTCLTYYFSATIKSFLFPYSRLKHSENL